MKKLVPLFALLFFVGSFAAYAQGEDGGYKPRLWKTMRYELIFGVGTNTFMGDLGGGEGEAAHFFGVKDFDFKATRPVIHFGARYKILERLAIKGSLSYARLYGSDEFSKEYSRQFRNLHFKSNVWEAAAQLEFSILKENRGRRYLFQRNSIINNMNLYLFGGIGYFHFNPKAEYEGETYELQPLGTGGQGIPDPKTGEVEEKYKLYEMAFPVGIGFKYFLSKHWSIGFEAGARYTSTDYLDDAHGTYFDNDLIRANYGDVAAALADRHIPATPTYENAGIEYDANHIPLTYPHGTGLRGQTEYNDAYVFFIVNLVYTFENAAKNRAKFFGLFNW